MIYREKPKESTKTPLVHVSEFSTFVNYKSIYKKYVYFTHWKQFKNQSKISLTVAPET